MSSQKKCPDCGSLEIVEDSHYAQNQLVCADCGFILTEGLLTTTYADEEHLQEVTYSWSTGQNEQTSRCVQRGTYSVFGISAKVLRLPSLFEDTAVSYYQQAIKRPCFSLVSLEKKEMLVGCCVFVTCRQHNWPLTMGTVCLLLYGDKELFAKTYLRFLKELALDVPTLRTLCVLCASIMEEMGIYICACIFQLPDF
uniref:Transcription factor IIIB 50 kDa subunit n=1 Tax=Podarcis muralis TaxID=64176 RepID=A0A670JW83_PODMU